MVNSALEFFEKLLTLRSGAVNEDLLFAVLVIGSVVTMVTVIAVFWVIASHI